MPLAPSSDTSYAAAVAGWTNHLRSGGTTTWSAWLDQPDHTSAPNNPLPDAVHLELVRRLNLAAGEPVRALADQVLATASPGRGLVDVPLPWPEGLRHYGSPAIEPERVPVEELIRLAVGVIVHLLPRAPRPASMTRPPAWPFPWRRRFRLHGSPGVVAELRRGLLAQGLVESDWRPTHVVIGQPVEVMMAEHWAASARAGGILQWATLWRRRRAAGGLPDEIDVAAIADTLAGRRREPVHVVLAPDAQGAAEHVADLLRARPVVVGTRADLAATDLLRRVNRLTALTAGPGEVRDLAARLLGVLEQEVDLPGRTEPWVPGPALSWAREQAAASARHLRDAGYPVHGDPGDLAPAEHPGSRTANRSRTLELAVLACLATWRLQEGTP